MIEGEQKKKEMMAAYKRLFRSDDGKAVMEDLERACNYHYSSVAFSAPNSLQTFFNEGKRHVVLRIKNILSTPDEQGGENA